MVNEALSKVLCHNICCLISSMYELGINPVFWGEEEKPEPEPTADTPTSDELMSIYEWI